ncbi:hypothetical protein U1Q18_002954 [Sarracenia purpurea var. burkii]
MGLVVTRDFESRLVLAIGGGDDREEERWDDGKSLGERRHGRVFERRCRLGFNKEKETPAMASMAEGGVSCGVDGANRCRCEVLVVIISIGNVVVGRLVAWFKDGDGLGRWWLVVEAMRRQWLITATPTM